MILRVSAFGFFVACSVCGVKACFPLYEGHSLLGGFWWLRFFCLNRFFSSWSFPFMLI
jgi:hypothetical protein